MLTETSKVTGGRVKSLYNVLKRKDNNGDRKKEMRSERENEKRRNYTDQNKTEKGDYTDEALALLNHLKPVMNLWRALMLALDMKFKTSKKAFCALNTKLSIASGFQEKEIETP